jgi:sorting nexin-25
MEFMDRRGRMRLVQFWLLVNNIKDPLEDADSDPLPQHSTWTQNDIDDLSAILGGYFSDSSLEVDPELKQDLAAFLSDTSTATPEQYQKARKAILVTQQSVYQNMEREDWPLFRKTDLWHKYLAATDIAPLTPARPTPPPKPTATAMTRSHSTGTLPSNSSRNPPRNDSSGDLNRFLRKAPKSTSSRIPSEESHVSSEEAVSRGADTPITEDPSAPNTQQSEEEVVNAISAALNDIIKSDSKDDIISVYSRTSSDLGERTQTTSGRSSLDIPRAETNVTDGRVPEIPQINESVRDRVPIFDDDDDYRPDFAIDTLTRPSDQNKGLGMNVDVIEELEMVEVDIERLKREIRLTTGMIGKAELTGSYDELRLLKDSRASMERELARKEQLRDTYASQDGEHHLTVSFLQELTLGKDHY